jgi:hypothetical protein
MKPRAEAAVSVQPVVEARVRPVTMPAEDIDELPLHGSTLVHDVVRPALAETERTVSVALGRINIDDTVKRAEPLKQRQCEKPGSSRRRSRSGLFRHDSPWG